jgi:hypothetical protein
VPGDAANAADLRMRGKLISSVENAGDDLGRR